MDKSNKGKYSYQRKGIPSKFKYEKWDKSAIVVNNKDEEQVKKILKKFGIDFLIMKLPKKKR